MQLDSAVYDLIYSIIDYTGIFLDGGLIVLLVNNYLIPKYTCIKKRPFLFISYICVCAFIYAVGFSNEFYYFVLSIFLSIFIYEAIFFRGALYRKLSLCCIYCSLYFIMDGVYLNFYRFLEDTIGSMPDGAGLFLVFFQRVICKFIMYHILRFLLRNMSVIDDHLPHTYVACMLGFCGFDILLLILNIFYLNPTKNDIKASPFLSVFMLGCLCMILCFIYLFTVMVRNYKENLRYQIQTKEWELHQQYLQQAQIMIEDSRKFRHDIKSHLFCMEGLVEQEKYGELKTYLEQFRDSEFLRLPFRSFCTDDSLNTLLNQKLQKASSLNISMEIKVNISNRIYVQKMDLCTILANLCDNAIEGACKADSPYVTVELKEIKGYLSLNVENSTKGDVLAENPSLVSTKGDQQFHGLGVAIVRNIVRKYNGSVNTSSEDGRFNCFVLLENQPSPE
ncbi:MAG: GHKL domain-containing protein [Eubacteriales bacterium]|nr:GHKL domain-containing protein [Eubacteriales bacterium]